MGRDVLPDPLPVVIEGPDPLNVLITNKPISQDYYLEISKGNVDGEGYTSKFGENPDIDLGSGFETIWDGGGVYVPPTLPRIHDIASDNVADIGVIPSSGTATGGSSTTLEDTTATFLSNGVVVGDLVLNDTDCSSTFVLSATETVLTFIGPLRRASDGEFGDDFANGNAYRIVQDGGLGASAIYLQGRDAQRLGINEFIVLNGLTVVETIYEYPRQRRMSALGTLFNTGAVGVITSTAQVDGTTSAQIINGNNQTLMAIDTIEANKTAYLQNWWGTLAGRSGATVILHLRIGILDGIGYIQQTRSISASGNSDFKFEFATPLRLSPGVDIWIEAESDANNADVSAGFEYTTEEL